MPNFAFYDRRKQATTKFYFSFCTGIGPKEFNSRRVRLPYIWQSKWVGIIAIKTERTQIHFLSDLLIAVALLNLKVSIISIMLSSVSYVCLGVCAGMWVISRGIYLVQLMNFLIPYVNLCLDLQCTFLRANWVVFRHFWVPMVSEISAVKSLA